MGTRTNKKKYRPYPLNDPCPCESGFTYGDCCKTKLFKYQLDARGDVVRSIKIPPAGMAILRRQKREFRQHFGREPGPHDTVFFQQLEFPNNYFKDGVREAGLAAGIDPAKVYASWKTGLTPVEGHLDRFTELELDEFELAAKEYRTKVAQGEEPFEEGLPFAKKERLQFSKLVAQLEKCPLVLASILSKEVRKELKAADFFQMFFATQALYFLRRFCSSMKSEDFDGGLYICRSIYEAVLRIRFLKYEPDSAKIFIGLAGVSGGTHEFVRRGNKVRWTEVRDKKSNEVIRVDISNYKMVAASNRKIDADVYAVLYRYLSRFVHPDTDAINRFFDFESGFAIFVEDNPFEGTLISGFLSVLLFSEVAQFSFLSKVQKRDARFYATRLSRTLRGLNTKSLTVFAGDFSCLKSKIEDSIRETQERRNF